MFFMENDQQNNQPYSPSLNDIVFENVTLQEPGKDPVLQAVDFTLPMDQTIVIESSRPQNAVQLLRLISGREQLDSGRILLNNQEMTFEDLFEDQPHCIGYFFESDLILSKMTFEKIFNLSKDSSVFLDLVERFDLQEVIDQDFQKLSFGWQKLAWLVKSVLMNPELLVLEDPAGGLSEKQWLDFLDYLQYKQRRGFARHVFMTNHHPTAMRHVAYNKIYVEDGLIYFDEEAGYKKASHF